jgi:ABC-type phosphate transport system substrate-binding protein
MSVRRLLAGVATTSIMASALAVAAAPAQADPAAGYVPSSSDIIGAGSDTSEFALNYLADGNAGVPGYNATAPANKLVSWNALPPAGAAATINLPGNAAATRPNGSGQGKAALFGAGNVPEIDFARSSSALSATEVSADLYAYPFALDELALATSKTSNAPATLTLADAVKIYNGQVTNWSELGGAPGAIVPMVPQSGSGTLSFFEAQLKAANGGNLTYPPTLVRVQEHDPSQVVNNPNAVAPFSIGRNAVSGATLRIEGGFKAQRALYNVVRKTDLAKPEIQAVFGEAGFICSANAKPLIEAAGFAQLAGTAGGGVCGVATQGATTNFATATVAATSTTVAGTSATAGALNLTATIAAGTNKPSGFVRFYLDGSATPSGTPAALTGGKATLNLTGVAAGAHSVVAKFSPTLTSYSASESAPTAVNVLAATPPAPTKATTKIKSTFKKSYKAGAKISGKITIKESADGKANGKFTIKLGKKVVAKGKVKNGVAKVKNIKGLKKGKNKLVVAYAGNSAFKASKLKLTITIK